MISALAIDTDGDGWDDLYEGYIGTDPDNPDTDGDYIPDNEDPTPKGGLLNEDEIWDVFIIEITPSKVLVDDGSTIQLNISAEELLPKGVRVPADNESGKLKVFWGSYYGTVDLVWDQDITIFGGLGSISYTPLNAGMYYFVLIMGDDTLGSQTNRYEMDWLKTKGKGGYCTVAVYPHYYATVSTIYYNLLPGMTGALEISFYEFNPEEDANLSKYSGSVSLTSNVLEELYSLSSGSVQVQVSTYGDSSKYTTQVNDTLIWEHVFTSVEYYTITVYSFDVKFAWDYTFSAKFTFSRSYVRVHNPEAIWYTVDKTELFYTAELSVHRYSLKPENMNASVFNDRYKECGSIKNIIEKYPADTTAWSGTAFLYALYTVYDYDRRKTAATIIAESSVTLSGKGTLYFQVTTPGSYRFTCKFGSKANYPVSQKFYYTYSDYDYNVDGITYFYVDSPLNLYVHTSTSEAFLNEPVETHFTMDDSTASYNIQAYLDGSKKSLLTPTGGSADLILSNLMQGEHELKGAIIFHTNTASLLDLFGIENFRGKWLDQTYIDIYALAIVADPPRNLIRGIDSEFRVIVLQGRGMPAAGADVTIKLTDYNGGQVIVFTGKCDSDGSLIVRFKPPKDHYYRMELTASTSTLSDAIITSISIRDQNYQGIITLNKPLYHPNDMIMARFLVFNKDTMKPVNNDVEVRLRDPYRRDIYRESVSLDEYGAGNISIPIGQKAPWGRYQVQVYNMGSQVGSVSFDVREYKTPEVKLTLGSAEAIQGENMTISAYVEYLFGQPVREGEVNFTIELQNEVPYYYHWYSYGRCEDSLYSRGRDYIGGWVYEPYVPYRTSETYYADVNVTNGWANVTLYVPYYVNRIFVRSKFTDDLEHEADDERAYYVGAAPVEDAVTKLTLQSSKSQWAVDENPDLSISLGYTLNGNYYPLPEKSFSLRLLAKDSQSNEKGPWELNGTTDISGTWQGSLTNFGLTTRGLLEQGYYWLEFSVVAEALEGGAATAALSMPIYRYVHSVSTEDVYYARGDMVNITLEQQDLLNKTGVPGEATVEIKAYYSNPYYDYYRGYYYDDLIYSNIFQLGNTGKLEFTWTVPLGLLPGMYTIDVYYENTTVNHRIQILDYESNVLTLSAPDKYKSGSKFTITGEFSKSYNGKIFIDTFSADTAHFSSKTIVGNKLSIEMEEFNTRATASVFIHYLDNGIYRTASISVSPEIPEIELLLELEKENYEPGDDMTLTITVLTDGKLSTQDFLLALVISDQGVYELVEDSMTDRNQLLSYAYPSWLNRGHFIFKNLREVLQLKQEGLSLDTEVRRIITKPERYSGGGGGGNYSYDDEANAGIEDGGMIPPSPKNGIFNWEEDYSGDSLDAELETTDVREFFTETAHFEPGLVINGRITLTIRLPDNIGRWRIKALASSKDLRGGVAISTFNVSKDFFIDLKLPSPLRQDDQTTFTIRVYNFAGKTIDAKVGIKEADAWLQILDELEKTVRLANGEVRDVKFLVNIIGYDWQSLTAIGSDFAGHTDALLKKVYIRPNGALKVIHEAGIVEGSKTITFSFDPELLNASEKVTLRLSPGYSGLLMDSAGALISYSYGCTEQTMSALLPNILIWEYLEEKGKLTRWIRYWLSRYIIQGVQHLYSIQHGDGGWGWWKGDDSDPWMTSYVLYGLARADKTGFYVDPSPISRAQNYLGSVMDENGSIPASTWMGNDNTISTAYAAYALAYSGSSHAGKAIGALDTYYNSGELKDPYVLCFYSLAISENDGDSSSIISKLASKRTGSHWESAVALGGNDEATGWCAYALTVAGNGRYKAEVRGALEYLAALRRPWRGWATTSDTIAAMHAILAVVKASGPINMDVSVSANGAVVKNAHIDDTYTSKQNFHSAMDAIDLTENVARTGKNTIQITKSGTGDLFYELTAVEYLRTEAVISIPTEINGTEMEETVLEVKVDPENSPNVDMVDAEVLVRESDELTVLYVEELKPDLEDDEWVFKVHVMPLTHGDIKITPIIVSYRLTAGHGESGVIRRYFGPVTMKTEPSNIGSVGTRSPISDVVFTKTLSKQIAGLGETIEVVIHLKGDLQELAGFNIVDKIPPAFKLMGRSSNNAQVVLPIDNNDIFTYSMILLQAYNGQLPPAKLENSEGISIAISNPVVFASSGEGITVVRTYSKTSAQVGDTIEVTISAHTDDETSYAVLEDFLPPACNFVTTSVEAVQDSETEVLDYSISGNKVAFFIKSLNFISFSYKFTVTEAVLAPIEPARAYGMYEPDLVGESTAKLFMSYETSPDELEIIPSQPEEGEGDGPVAPTDGDKDDTEKLLEWALQPILLIVAIVVIISILAVIKKRKEKALKTQKKSKVQTKQKLESKDKGEINFKK